MDIKLPKYNIADKVALITGAAGMLGIQHSKALLEIGASIILTDLNEVDLKIASDYLENEGMISFSLEKKIFH